MCGIAGLVSLNHRPLDVRPLAGMMDVAQHRGPDGQGYALFDQAQREIAIGFDSQELIDERHDAIQVAFGHRRLAIIDLSDAARQPMSYDSGRYWIVFNGAIYNYVELQAELEQHGYAFQSTCDTEVILAAYQHWGDACVQHFNGMFAIAIYDQPNSRVVCFRDRLGIKPFYYAIHEDVFVFASEIKQLLAADVPRRVNERRAFEYLIVGTTDHHAETCFDGVFQLPNAHRLELDLKANSTRPQISRYWQPRPDDGIAELPAADAAGHIRELLQQAVSLRLRCDVPLGSCLSGGLDSSSIVTLMAHARAEQQLDFEQHTFTYQPDEARIDESHFADMVANQVGAIRHTTRIDPDQLVESLDQHLWHEEEPIGDLTHFARSQVMSLAKQTGVTVVLDGQGGDELFLGYERYYVPAFRRYWKDAGLMKALREFRLATQNSKLGAAKLLTYAFLFGNASIRESFFRQRSLRWINRDFLQRNDLASVVATHQLPNDIWELQSQELLDVQLPHLLRHEDRNSMASSIEARTPLLDHELVEFVMALGVQSKIHDGWTKYGLRLAMEGLLPREIQWRRDKLGFAVPQAKWVSVLSAYVKNQLDGELACESFIDRDKLRAGIQGNRFDDKMLWRIMSLEKTMRLFQLHTNG